MSKGGGQKSTSAGFNKLPAEIKNAFTTLGTDVQSNLLGGAGQQAFTPLPFTGDEQQAFSMLRQGFTPTAESFAADMAMLQDPYQQSVINQINRQGQGEYSLLQEAMNQAGQLGSNRNILGANDIDMARMDQIGGFLSNQWNQNQNAVLNQLPALRQADVQGLLGIGEAERNMNTADQQANINSLITAAQIMGVFPKAEGSSSSSSQGGGLLGTIGAAGGLLSGLGAVGAFGAGAATPATQMTFLSDRRIKENIERVGDENGYPVYKFNYIGSDKKWVGVMAQDVQEVMPEAVENNNDILRVNYDMIGVRMREA